MRLHEIMSSAWSILPRNFEEINAIYETHMRGEKIDIVSMQKQMKALFLDEDDEEMIFGNANIKIENGVAILPIRGVITLRNTFFTFLFGGASIESLSRDFAKLVDDDSIHSIILDIDSPGGSVDGIQEFSKQIFDARNKKNIISSTSSMMASAAYWIGSAADIVRITSGTVQVGSIGVIVRHTDRSKLENEIGIKTTEVVAGKYKDITTETAPLSTQGRQTLQQHVDFIYTVFLEDVARNRATSVEDVLTNMADGRIFIGEQSIEAGLADGVSTLPELVDELQTAGANAVIL